MKNFIKASLWGATVVYAFFLGRYVEWKDWHTKVTLPLRKMHDELLEKYPELREE